MIRPKLLNKKARVFLNTISVPLILANTVQIGLEELREMIAEDLAQCISIMDYHSMFRRVVNFHHGVVPIQNYFKLRES